MRTADVALMALLALVSACVYVNSVDGEFAFDDRFAIVENDDVDPTKSHWTDMWRHDFWGQDIERLDSHKVRVWRSV